MFKKNYKYIVWLWGLTSSGINIFDSLIVVQRNLDMLLADTHKAPAPAGPIALKKDIAVAAMPLAAPLWLCGCFWT